MRELVFGSVHPIVRNDQQFFLRHRWRNFRLRPYIKGEFGFDHIVTFFVQDVEGCPVEGNVVVVQRRRNGRKRHLLFIDGAYLLDSDAAIARLLKTHELRLRKATRGRTK